MSENTKYQACLNFSPKEELNSDHKMLIKSTAGKFDFSHDHEEVKETHENTERETILASEDKRVFRTPDDKNKNRERLTGSAKQKFNFEATALDNKNSVIKMIGRNDAEQESPTANITLESKRESSNKTRIDEDLQDNLHNGDEDRGGRTLL